jgi:8-oxo-dGTP diphosphatase
MDPVKALTHRDIHKAGGIIIVDRRLLVERSKGKTLFNTPGGKLEPDEPTIHALIRELREEFQIVVFEEDITYFDTYSASVDGEPNRKIKMEAFLINKWAGELTISEEVEEMAWVSSKETKRLSSILSNFIVPKLHSLDLID